jgi:hypothetical protein
MLIGRKAIYILILITISHYTISGSVDFKQYDIDSQPIDLVWCGPTRDTVFVVTELNSLYRSDDKGFSWKKLNDVLLNSGKAELDENENEVTLI